MKNKENSYFSYFNLIQFDYTVTNNFAELTPQCQ